MTFAAARIDVYPSLPFRDSPRSAGPMATRECIHPSRALAFNACAPSRWCSMQDVVFLLERDPNFRQSELYFKMMALDYK